MATLTRKPEVFSATELALANLLLSHGHAQNLPLLLAQDLHDLRARQLARQHGGDGSRGESVGDAGAERAAAGQFQLVVGVQPGAAGQLHAGGGAEGAVGLWLVLEAGGADRDDVA